MMAWRHKKDSWLYGIVACVLFILLLPQVTIASPETTRIEFENASAGSVGLGFGLRYGRSPYKGVEGVSSINNENQHDLVPLYLYEGKYFFARGTAAGLHLYQEGGFTVDVLGRYRFDRLQASASKELRGLHDRDQTVDGGLAVGYEDDWGSVTVEWLGDMLNKHNGEELALTYRYHFDWQRWDFSPYIAYVRQDEDLANYYYGVAADEAAPGRPAYNAGAREFFRAGLNSTYHLDEQWKLNANIGFEGLGHSGRHSPLTDREQLPSLFLSATYLFGDLSGARLKRVSESVKQEREHEWSWRINYGYNADKTFNRIHRGELGRDNDIDTHLAGITFGKLLSGGRKVDFYGKFSLNRRLEKDFHSNFWEYVAYVMAMGKGYAPWSEQVAFRYGFGFGFSYAERVPIIEQLDQERRGREDAHFLNYLEAQVDFPLNGIFDHQSVKNCYAGLTLVHRSGIFASADILGNVNGGSNVITGHVECLR